MMNVVFQDESADAKEVLNTAKENAKQIIDMLFEMKSIYLNPPL